MKKFIAIALGFAPVLASAQSNGNSNIIDAGGLVAKLVSLGNLVIQILIAFAVIYIIFNVVRYIMAADKPEERNAFGKAILWGIVGLFIILSIWGLVNILKNTFSTNSAIPTDQFPSVNFVTDPAATH